MIDQKNKFPTHFSGLFSFGVNMRKFEPKTPSETLLYDLLTNSRIVKKDFTLLGDMVSLRQLADHIYVSDENSIVHAFLAYDRNRSVWVEEERDSTFDRLCELWTQGVKHTYFDYERGFPVYVKRGSDYVEENTHEYIREFLDAFKYSDDYFEDDVPLNLESEWLDGIYVSVRERNLFWSIVWGENETGSIAWKVQSEAFRAYIGSAKNLGYLENPSKNEKPLMDNERRNLLKTIGLMTKAISDKSENRYKGKDGKININAIAADLQTLLDDKEGLSDSSLRKKMSAGIQQIKDALKYD